MLRLEVDTFLEGRRLILEAEEEIKVKDFIGRIGIVLGDGSEGMLISCDKEGVLPPDESLSDLSIASGERLLYLRRKYYGSDKCDICKDEHPA